MKTEDILKNLDEGVNYSPKLGHIGQHAAGRMRTMIGDIKKHNDSSSRKGVTIKNASRDLYRLQLSGVSKPVRKELQRVIAYLKDRS